MEFEIGGSSVEVSLKYLQEANIEIVNGFGTKLPNFQVARTNKAGYFHNIIASTEPGPLVR